jgi:hypothetical protein
MGRINYQAPCRRNDCFHRKNLVVVGELGAKQLQEFIDEVLQYQPASAAAWLNQYLPCVRVIYAFQLLQGTAVAVGSS